METSQVAARRTAALVLIAALAGAAALEAQVRQPAQGSGRGQAGAGRGTARGAQRGQLPPAGLSPREIQAQFDAYVVAQAEEALQITEDQYPQFVRRVRALQAARRQARIQRSRLLNELNGLVRTRDAVDDARLTAAVRAVDEQERNTLVEIQRAYAAIDEVLQPWQRARFRVIEDQLEQKKIEMLVRARQGPRR